jgi:hypothetical protein
MQFGAAPASACGSFSFGEVEDYTVNIFPLIIKLPLTDTSIAAKPSEDAVTKQSLSVKTASVSVIPNPVVSGNAKLLYTPDASGPVSLKLIDLSGRVLKTISIGNKTAGSYTQALNDISGFKAGSYMLVMEQNGKVTARSQFIIAR